MKKRQSIYLKRPMVEVLEARNLGNTSDMINKFVTRYDSMVRRFTPKFTMEEFDEIFLAAKFHDFSTDTESDVTTLANVLKRLGVSSELVKRVISLKYEMKVGLIDLIERAQAEMRVSGYGGDE